MARFNLSIELGNDAMRTKADLLKALLQARKSIIRELNLRDKRVGANTAKILDRNGNGVGRWEVSGDA